METPPDHQSEQPTPASTLSLLFTLPLELRLEIFGFCVPRKCAIRVTSAMYRPYGVEPVVSTRDTSIEDDKFLNTSPHWTGILHVSKQMSAECLDILYGDNLFEVYLHGKCEDTIKRVFSHENIQRIQFILAVAPGPSFSGELNPPDVPFWAMMIPNLKLFEWVTQPDKEVEQQTSDLVMMQGLGDWMEWTDAYLNCFSEFLADGMEFRMKLDKGEDEYRQIGRLYFKRGPFFKKDEQQEEVG
ncbi:hypothetical protein DTO013E5_4922 [Penicillium roqueforti]|uniref:Genomic scaffold, ProqFM164S03 n=1 Tax=Penicillium roqueforti (strain FM164) TaxID=1365484 RepID=W6QJM2_PENRF|nr:hypothetical protein CBS147337_8993 [Penicillium roqueforti]CDM34409.1 unnamed protein product [Penicillium roqueforti FM164]KAI2672091.1 hypothetical protein CBS147355_8243 [Penicillium roqueforti]KAI2692482.1 hypothetical protein LCP963914a_576 [Penicillium roqueforti]KAI2705430.1 hypothetical protein CBS147372_1733 [Penicillium roqueforti]